MTDLSKMSDEELQSLRNRTRKQAYLSSLPDEQLQAERAVKQARTHMSRPMEIPESGVTTWPQLMKKAAAVGDEIAAESPALAGAGLGALAASPGGPLAMIPAAIAGGVTGKLAQEGVEQGLMGAGIVKEGDKLVSDYPLQNKDIQQILLDAGMSGIEMGLGEATGQAMVGPFSKMARGASKTVKPEQAQAYDFWKGAVDEQGRIMPSPAQFTESRVLDVGHNIGEASYLSGGKFMDVKDRAIAHIDKKINDLYAQPGHSKEQLGKLLEDSIESYEKIPTGASKTQLRAKGSHQAFNDATDILYKRLDAEAGKEFVNTASVAHKVRMLINEVSEAVTDPTLLKRLQNVGRQTVGPEGNLIQGMRFSEAQALRSDLLDIARKGDKGGISNKATGRAKSLANEVHNLMGVTAKRAGVEDKWLKANAFYTQGVDTFNDAVIKKIVSLDPDQAVTKILDAGKDRAVTVKRIKRAIRDKGLINEIENKLIEKIVFRATDVETGMIKPKAILTELKNFGGTDGRALRMMFPKGQDKVLKRLADIKDVSFRPMPDATGRLWVQLGQPTALGAMATGAFFSPSVASASAFVLIAPEMVARAMTNPRIVDFLVKGAKPRPGLKQSVTFMSRLAALLQKEKIEFKIEDQHQIMEVPQRPSPLQDNRPRY